MRSRILVVEDDQYIRESLKELLEIEGFSVACAVNGQDALDQLAAGERPCLILLDLMMPVKDGYQFSAEKATHPEWAGIPLVVMSADGHAEEKLAQVRASSYLKKPVDVEAVLSVVARCRESADEAHSRRKEPTVGSSPLRLPG